MDNNLVQSTCRLISCFLESFVETEFKKVPQEDLENLQTMLKSIFLFSFIWSILATVDDISRKKLNIYFRDRIKDDPENGIPKEKSIYDYYFNI